MYFLERHLCQTSSKHAFDFTGHLFRLSWQLRVQILPGLLAEKRTSSLQDKPFTSFCYSNGVRSINRVQTELNIWSNWLALRRECTRFRFELSASLAGREQKQLAVLVHIHAAICRDCHFKGDLSSRHAGDIPHEPQSFNTRVRSSWLLFHEHSIFLHDKWMARQGFFRELEETFTSKTPVLLLQ